MEPARVCLIGKYPPIQGGVSARNYWTARWLAQRGHDVHVVTNADEVEPAFRIRLQPEDDDWLAPRFDRGAVRVWRTEAHGPRSRHIPDHNPFVSKLTSVALAAIEESRADVIVSVYLEPYALAGYLASSLTGVPLVLRHAGSDVGRLLAHRQLGPCYEGILRRADLVCGSASTMERFAALGVPAERLQQDAGFALPEEVFHPGAPATEPPEPGVPTIGIYGKLGAAKGSFDLVAALGRLRTRGLAFRLLALCGGEAEQVERFRRAVHDAGIGERTHLLPFRPHWRVPGFLRSLRAACFLEHRFPIAAHGPGIPQEVMAVAAPLVTTLEIARKQTFASSLVHGETALLVRDPRDHAELAAALEVVLTDPARAEAIGRAGRACLPPARVERFVGRYEAILERAQEARRPRRRHRRRPPALPAYQDELLRFERLQVPDPERTAATDALFFRVTPEAMDAAVPVRPPHVEVGEFRYDMESLQRAAGSARPPARWPEARSCYVFQHLPGRARNRVTRVGGQAQAFVASVDGRSTVADLLARLGAPPAPAVTDGIAQLFRDGILVAAASVTQPDVHDRQEEWHGQGTHGRQEREEEVAHAGERP